MEVFDRETNKKYDSSMLRHQNEEKNKENFDIERFDPRGSTEMIWKKLGYPNKNKDIVEDKERWRETVEEFRQMNLSKANHEIYGLNQRMEIFSEYLLEKFDGLIIGDNELEVFKKNVTKSVNTISEVPKELIKGDMNEELERLERMLYEQNYEPREF
ncbi:hypothetical protein RCL_jg24525.t1 [Rhizophagus clarus]|uniref:Uncharacterized protein n=1 Tax=Rhizophagus clarus TaxID=94130 RepID=A0A8H3R4X3_9GLOM|nr:hypothetical protein RCL_jg24525.t1 [Rhizophagus clarus]